VLPLHARQASWHWFRFFFVGQERQKATHRSGLVAQAVPASRGPKTIPAKAALMRRNDSRRDMEPDNDFENSSRRFIINTDGKKVASR
jgi:hypothetical protein